MPSNEPHSIALFAKTRHLNARDLTRVAAALQRQVRRDFFPVWHIDASVQAFHRAQDVPRDAWKVTVVDRLKDAEGMGSFHSIDQRGQPYVEVAYGAGWTIGASHDLMEMLVDPELSRHEVAPALDDGRRQVKYSVQICDPCAAKTYKIDGVTVADFTTPDYWRGKTGRRGKYSHTGAVNRPRQILRGGYLSWLDTQTNRWVQRNWFGKTLSDLDLGPDAAPAGETGETTTAAVREVRIRFHVRMLQEAYRDQEPRLRWIRESVEALIARFPSRAH